MSLAGTALPSTEEKNTLTQDTHVAILVIEATAATPLGPKIVFANDAVLEETGYEKSSLVGSPLGLIYDRADLRSLIEKLPVIADRPGYCWMDRVLIRNGGSREIAHWTIRPTHRRIGEPPHFTLTFSVNSDLPMQSEEPSIEEEEPAIDLEDSFQDTRQESLAMAAGGVAHDFKNALQAIKSNLEMARSISGSNSRLSTYLGDANLALDDAEILAHQMLAFTRDDQVGDSVFNLGDLVKRVSSLCTAGSRVSCHLTVEPNLRPVEGDPNRIYQVLHNLVINACQAMPSGGVLHLTAGNGDFGDENPFSVPGGNYSVVSVRDRGCGIPEEILPRIFEQNFSTKPDGSGFGLASCRAIVELHQGAIRAASKVGVGTEFLVFLPSCAVDTGPTPPATVENPASSKMDGRNENVIPLVPSACRILIVEDQPGVLKATQGILGHLGHETLSALNGEDAISTYRRHLDSAEPIDVVLLDMTLPGGLNGLDVLRELKKADPDVLVIATSGYFDDEPGDTYANEGFTGLLAKPFSMNDLSISIGEALGQ